jgi:hypothetical protein
MTQEQKPPRELGFSGRRLWRQVVREAAVDGLVLDAREQIWLEIACKSADTIALMEAELTKSPTTVVKGVAGQPVAHPLLAEIRQHHLLIAQTLNRLKVEAPASGWIAVPGANKARGAATARWRPGGGA